VSVAYDGVIADDFAFDVHGNLYATTDPFNTVDRVSPDGTQQTLLTAADGLAGPSAAAFGTSGGDRTSLYITNLSFFEATPRPSLQRIDVGVPGYRIPLGPPGDRRP
jgi:sugar lactone lactonase YvrE